MRSYAQGEIIEDWGKLQINKKRRFLHSKYKVKNPDRIERYHHGKYEHSIVFEPNLSFSVVVGGRFSFLKKKLDEYQTLPILHIHRHLQQLPVVPPRNN